MENLRLGNLITTVKFHPETDAPLIDVSTYIGTDGEVFFTEDGEVTEISGIEITQMILKKIGFTPWGSMGNYFSMKIGENHFVLSLNNGGNNYKIEVLILDEYLTEYKIISFGEVKYLHELQNKFYYLTDTELDTKALTSFEMLYH